MLLNVTWPNDFNNNLSLQILWHWPNPNFKISQQTNKYLALFHIKACSLNKNFDDLGHLLKCTNNVFDIIAVTETRIAKQTSLTTNINLRNYAIEFTSTESSAGGSLLYIASHLSYKLRPDLNIYISNQFESTFVEIINHKKVILLLVVFRNIEIWMLLISKITILAKFLKLHPKNKNRYFFLVTLNFWIITIIN